MNLLCKLKDQVLSTRDNYSKSERKSANSTPKIVSELSDERPKKISAETVGTTLRQAGYNGKIARKSRSLRRRIVFF